MRRKEPVSTSRGKSLISTRTNQQQQRKLQMSRNLLPRSFSSPAQHELQSTGSKSYVMRSFSSPEPKHLEYRRNSNSYYKPKSHGSRSELDSDLENFEQFEDSLIDIDADQEETARYRSSPDRNEPKRVITTLLPGSGLHKITLRPIPSTTQSLYCARDTTKILQKEDCRGKIVCIPITHLEFTFIYKSEIKVKTNNINSNYNQLQLITERNKSACTHKSILKFAQI